MKKLCFLAVAVALSIASCSEDNEVDVKGGTSASRSMSFTAKYSDKDGTRATLNGNNETFDAGDAITIISAKNRNTKFVTSTGGSTVTFTGSAEYDDVFHAVYPYQSNCVFYSSNSKIGQLQIPNAQWNDCWAEGDLSGWDPNAPLAYAVGSPEGTLYFRNLCAILKITIGPDDNGVSLTIGADQKMVGECAILNGALTVDSNVGKNKLTVGNANNKVAGGTSVYVAIAPGEYDNFYVTSEDISHTTSKTKAHATFEANKIYDLGTFTFERTYIQQHEYVDLGLPSGLCWAMCNVGAFSPAESGSFYSWGGNLIKEAYTWTNYEWSDNNDVYKLTKYNSDSSKGLNGFVDNKMSLDSEDDIAYQAWGNGWRMPSKDEFQELLDNCNRRWISNANGTINGYKLESKINGKTLFLPAAGYRDDSNYYGHVSHGQSPSGAFWTSSLKSSNCLNAYNLSIASNGIDLFNRFRNAGLSIRPVFSTQTVGN